MHFHLDNEMWWLAGRYGGALVIGGALWLCRQHWFPHRHDGYVSVSGYVRKCSHCSRLPAGAVRAGFYGTDPGSPEARRYDALLNSDQSETRSAHDCRDSDDIPDDIGSPDENPVTIARAARRPYAPAYDAFDQIVQWGDCPSCGREDMPMHMRDGECIRCWAIHNHVEPEDVH